MNDREKPRGSRGVRLAIDPTMRMPSGRPGSRSTQDEVSSKVAVLFVDDEPSVLRAIKRTLMDAPFEVLTAFDATEALAIFENRAIDVLVSDIDMPGMNGLELVAVARRRFPATLRMLLTGQSTLARALQAINEGEVARFFPKPFDPRAFRQTLEALAGRIEQMRRDGEERAQASRRVEFHGWMEASFPGVTSVDMNASGEVVIDVDRLTISVEAARALELLRYLRPSRG